MANIRIRDLANLASSSASDDFLALDGLANGTRKLNAFSPTFGGNATVTGSLTAGSGTFNGTVLISSNVGTIGKAGSGTGGNWRFITDDNVTRWLAGILGGAGETSFDLYDIVNGRSLLTLTAAGVVKVPQTTPSTTTSSGALVIGNGTSGGLGVGGAINAGGNITTTGATQPEVSVIKTGTGAGTGSLGIASDGVFVGSLTAAVPLNIWASGAPRIAIDGTRTAITSTTPSTTTSSGALVVSGGVGIAGSLNVGSLNSLNIVTGGDTGSGTSILLLKDGLGANKVNFQGNGQVQFLNTTASTTTSSGALVVSGGVGVGNEVSVYGRVRAQLGLHADGNVPAGLAAAYQTDVQSGTTRDILSFGNSSRAGLIRGYQDGGGVVQWSFGRYTASLFEEQMRLSGTTAASSSLTIYGTTASTSTSSGALVVAGGVGVAGNTNIGGVVSVGGSSNAAVGVYVINTALTGVDQYGVASEPIWTSAAVSGHTIWARTKTAASAFTLTNGTAIYVELPTLGSGSSITNNYGLRIANQGAAGVANAYGVDILAQSGASSTNVGLRNAGTTLLTNSTASTTTSSGALVVSGGVGVGGAINAGGDIATGGTMRSVGFHVPGNGAGRPANTDSYLASTATTQIPLYVSGYTGGGQSADILRVSLNSTSDWFAVKSNGQVACYATTASTSTSSGALVVSGGVGVAGAIFAGGAITTGNDGSNVSLYVPGDTAIRTKDGSSTKLYIDTKVTDGGDIVFRPRVNTALTLAAATGNATFVGNITTAAPAGGTAAAWKLGTVATVSPTSPNRTIEVDIGGTIYYIHAKTTNN